MKVFRVLTYLCLMLSAVAAYSMSVKTDYDTNYDFSRLKTFAFKEQRRSASDPLRTDTLVADRIRDAIRSQLEARGFRYQPEGQPDFLIAYYARAKDEDGDRGLRLRIPAQVALGMGIGNLDALLHRRLHDS